jgi:hypothetical protein
MRYSIPRLVKGKPLLLEPGASLRSGRDRRNRYQS